MNKFLSTDKKDQGRLFKLFFDYSYKRSLGGAVIFYIIQVLSMYAVTLVASKILFYIFLLDINSTSFRFVLISIIAAYVLLSQLSILHEKKLFNNKTCLVLVALSVLLTIFFGGLIGFLPIIYLAMQEKNNYVKIRRKI